MIGLQIFTSAALRKLVCAWLMDFILHLWDMTSAPALRV